MHKNPLIQSSHYRNYIHFFSPLKDIIQYFDVDTQYISGNFICHLQIYFAEHTMPK